MNQDRLAEIVRDKSLTPCALRLMLALMADMEGGNLFKLSQSECARQLDYTRRQINRAWKQLREAGYIEDAGDPGRPNWAVVPDVCWRGKARGLRQELQKRYATEGVKKHLSRRTGQRAGAVAQSDDRR